MLGRLLGLLVEGEEEDLVHLLEEGGRLEVQRGPPPPLLLRVTDGILRIGLQQEMLEGRDS